MGKGRDGHDSDCRLEDNATNWAKSAKRVRVRAERLERHDLVVRGQLSSLLILIMVTDNIVTTITRRSRAVGRFGYVNVLHVSRLTERVRFLCQGAVQIK